jgi:integrase
MTRHLALLPAEDRGRVGRDRLELLSALIDAPGFDPLYRPDIISIPRDHPVYGWGCEVAGCECTGRNRSLCDEHYSQWRAVQKDGTARADFIAQAVALTGRPEFGTGPCRICPERPARGRAAMLCTRHADRWRSRKDRGISPAEWAAAQEAFPGYGTCRVPVCLYLAESPAGLCPRHLVRYRREGRPGNMRLPANWVRVFEVKDLPVPVACDDEKAFRRWRSAAGALREAGGVNLAGLQPLVRAEIRWGMHAHAQLRSPARWHHFDVQRVVDLCRDAKATSLFDLAGGWPGHAPAARPGDAHVQMVMLEITEGLRCVYYSPDDTREAGFIETDHFGRRFGHARSHFDLTAVSQRWLRDLLWDHLTRLLRLPKPPRSRGPFDNLRRAAVELSAFLESDAPEGGHDPRLLREEHAQRFAADQRRRAREGLPSPGVIRRDGSPAAVTETTQRLVFTHMRALAYQALETGGSDAIGLDRAFITALPPGGHDPRRSRGPFSDEAARALADEANLRRLAGDFDQNDRGIRDIWETIVLTGRRCREVIDLRLDCIARHHGLAMLWHDQTKVQNLDQAIRIPEYLYVRLEARRATSLARFENRHGRPPTAAERAEMALFPTHIRSVKLEKAISYGYFNEQFRSWVNTLDLGRQVAHQARHSMATNLLRAGATLAHVRRFLGQVSDRMAEHYIQVAHSDLEDFLGAVWVSGPGSPSPGKLLSGGLAPMSREQALALSLDLSRRSTAAEGGFCTYQPVVRGSACPFNLDCGNCDKFVMSGADLLYWRRKQEQWRAIAERAPDDATADYLHQVFEPTARAIDGLEKALAALGLLDQALTLDMRRPQDYFHRIWSTAFRAADLTEAGDDDGIAELTGEPA